MHPAWEHVRLPIEDPAAALAQRLEVGRRSGVPAAVLERYRESRQSSETGIDAIQVPDRDLVPGVEVETGLGTWQVYEAPRHAPSHVVLHQPERKRLISGDHLLGRAFRNPRATIAESRRRVEALLDKVRAPLSTGDRTAFEIVGELIGPENLDSPVSAWALEIVLACLDHLALESEVAKVQGADPQRWTLAQAPG